MIATIREMWRLRKGIIILVGVVAILLAAVTYLILGYVARVLF